jgi:hypothetical protein
MQSLDDRHPLSTSPGISTEPITARCCRSVYRNRQSYPGTAGVPLLFSASGCLPQAVCLRLSASVSLTSDAVEGVTAAELLLGMGS